MREILFRGKRRGMTFERLDDILRAIRAKGGVVPEGTRIDKLGACILSIPHPEDVEEDV